MSERIQFAALPRVVPAGRMTRIRIAPVGSATSLVEGTLTVTHLPAEGWGAAGGPAHAETLTVTVHDGGLAFAGVFEGEQEHVLIIEREVEGGRQRLGAVRIYSLEPDLFALRPYKGDLHIHSVRSDGREPPPAVVAACREIGMDFVAVTDHRLYEPSLEAIAAFASVPVDLLILPGEEVHAPGNPAHIINFGGEWSVNAMFETPKYAEGLDRLQEELQPLPAGVDATQAASCFWCFEEIRRAGGLGVFCHPYWFTRDQYSPSGALTSYLLEKRPFDALEVIGGYYRHEVDSNTLQVARYHEERLKGGPLPVVGVSDAHGCRTGELFGWYYTIAFAPQCTREHLTEAIRRLQSVAVEAVAGESLRAHGPFRLVKYALFLCREVMPEHDALCSTEGHLMMRYLTGDERAAVELGELQGQVSRYFDRVWAR